MPPCRAAARARSGAMASARDDDRRPPRRAHLVFPDFGEIAVTKPGDRNSKKKKGDLIHKSLEIYNNVSSVTTIFSLFQRKV